MAVEGARHALCVFEHIYFARPDSRLGGQVLQVSRGRMGEILAREAPVDADLVIAVPDSGNAAARGYARASGLPQDDGFVKNRYVARTFIQPGQELRKHGLRMKFNPLPEVVAGQRLVVVDDSIVRGNTTRQIVQMLRDAGASEVHMRISAPPIRNPCHYGIDMSTREEMIAHGRTEAEIAAELGADSLAYLSLDGVYEAIERRRARRTATPASRATTRSRTRASRSPRTRSSSRSSAPSRTGYATTSSRNAPSAARIRVDVRLRVGERGRRPGAGDRIPDAAVGQVEAPRVDQRGVDRARRLVGVARQLRLEADPGAPAEPVRAPRQPVLRGGCASIPSASRAPSARDPVERLRRLDVA